MANRFWVGGTAAWDNIAGSKWSTTSGGSGGASVPTAADDVFFDANSGASAVTVGFPSICDDLIMTGFTGSFVNSPGAISIYGSFTGSASGATFDDGINFWFRSTNAGETITTNGMAMCGIACFGVGGEWTLQDTFTQKTTGSNRSFSLSNGKLFTNGQTVTVALVFISGSNTRTVDITNSTIITDNTDAVPQSWRAETTTGLTFVSTGSTIRIAHPTALRLGGLTYNNLEIQADTRIEQSNTLNVVTVDANRTLTLTAGTTQTINDLVSNGTAGNLASLTSSSAATLSKASGTVEVNFLNITNNTATGGATFNANPTSVDGGGNTGWNFLNGNFFQMF